MPADFAITVHLAGFITGMALYAMLLGMTARLGTGGDRLARARASAMPGLMPYGVSLLGLLWNAIAFVYFTSRDFGLGDPSAWLGATGYSALGFLPAVVVHSAILSNLRSRGRWLALPAYLLSAVGAALQYLSASRGLIPSPAGLQILTVGYALVLVTLLALFIRERLRWQRSLIVVALAAFAVSALHLSQPEAHNSSWPVELIGHHASLPLVLVLLYQDYRFAFADIFLRRALSLVALVSIALALHGFIAEQLPSGVTPTSGTETLVSTIRHVGLWVLTALAYPYVRRGVGFFVDRVVLHRANYTVVREELGNALQRCTTVDEAVGVAATSLDHALGVNHATIMLQEVSAPGSLPEVPALRWDTRIRVPSADAPFYELKVSNLTGGRRLLSDDHALLDWLVISLARRIDVIRITDERFSRDLREEEIVRLATEAELRALRAQLNPHFLFNALSTIAFLLQSSPPRALDTLYRLTHLLRAVLRRSTGAFIALSEELELVESYLAIESARFEERLTVHIDVPDALRPCRIPPLLLQPLVENAIKHGISPLARGGAVTVRATSYPANGPEGVREMLLLEVIDTGVGLRTDVDQPGDGIGLSNIESRLQRYYGSFASLELGSGRDRGTCARVRVPLLGANEDIRYRAVV